MKFIIIYLQCVSVLSATAGGVTFSESAVQEFMKLGAVFAHVGYANPFNSIN